MKIGTYYYPEQWPREQWERDFDNMAGMGLQIVHMGEFAWYTMEPRPGDIQLDWLQKCVELAAERKLDVILCTPTAAPPIWLAQEFPETLPVDEHGERARFGGRRHYTPTSPALHEAARRIVTALADRFGNHPAVIGWQIDNEYSGAFDQSEQTHAAFREWLQRRYATIDELNRAWGCQFWNTFYTDFSQVRMPATRDTRYANPHHHLDASRFWSWAYANFNKLQADLLKPKIGNRFITTNFMPLHLDCNPSDMAGDLSLLAWDSYPVTGWVRAPSDQAYRMADPAAIGFMHDLMASYTGRWALLELQTGQINWSGVPVLLYPGAVRLWVWTAFAHGAEFVTTYRYRQPLFGQEMFHTALVGTDGVTPSIGGRQFVQVIDEMKRLTPAAPTRRRAAARPAPRVPSVGLLFDFEQLWWFKTLPQALRWDQPRWLGLWYQAIARLGLRVEILHPTTAWPADVSVIVAPAMQMVDEPLVRHWEEFVARGGHLLLTCRTALMDRRGQLWEGPIAKPILPLIGASIEAYDALPEDAFGTVEMDDVNHRWGVWGELLYAEEETRILAKYADQFYADGIAVTQAKHEQGVVTYCGVFAEASFVEALMEKIATQAQLPITALPSRVQLLRRGPHRILLNYQETPVTAPAPRGVKFLVGSRTVEPAGVAVWEE